MRVPDFILRKLYKRGSLRETGDGRVAFTLQNPLGKGTLVAPPRILLNGILAPIESVRCRIDLAHLSPDAPYVFTKGEKLDLDLPGRLLRGGNRLQIIGRSKEWGELELFVEDREATTCDVPAPAKPADV
ncbi:MAG: hypothetical protein AABX89_07995 [Candidatus Thermoplasmatota archaeon]